MNIGHDYLILSASATIFKFIQKKKVCQNRKSERKLHESRK